MELKPKRIGTFVTIALRKGSLFWEDIPPELEDDCDVSEGYAVVRGWLCSGPFPDKLIWVNGGPPEYEYSRKFAVRVSSVMTMELEEVTEEDEIWVDRRDRYVVAVATDDASEKSEET